MFYLNVFYLPVLKQVNLVGQHKMWNDVMFWFSQMIFYNAYIPLLIAKITITSPIVIKVPTRALLAGETKGSFVRWLANLNIKRNCV